MMVDGLMMYFAVSFCRLHSRFGYLLDYRRCSAPCCGLRGVLLKLLGRSICKVCKLRDKSDEYWPKERRVNFSALSDEFCRVYEEVEADRMSMKEAVLDLKDWGVNSSIEKRLRSGNVPAVWRRGLEVEQHVDVPMHLLFLGITKTILRQLHRWLRLQKKESAFFKSTNERLLLVKGLCLFGWLNPAPYGDGNFGGWVAESYLAVSRVLPWLLMDVGELVECE